MTDASEVQETKVAEAMEITFGGIVTERREEQSVKANRELGDMIEFVLHVRYDHVRTIVNSRGISHRSIL